MSCSRNHAAGRPAAFTFALFASCFAFLFAYTGCTRQPAPEQTADAIYTGGDIVTMNDAQPSVEAVAVKTARS